MNILGLFEDLRRRVAWLDSAKCKNCAHWGGHWPGDSTCQKVDRRGDRPLRMFDHEAVVYVDNSPLNEYSVNASLLTGPEFGCVKFEPKED